MEGIEVEGWEEVTASPSCGLASPHKHYMSCILNIAVFDEEGEGHLLRFLIVETDFLLLRMTSLRQSFSMLF